MVDDLIRRLEGTPLYYGSGEDAAIGEEAADRITALQAQNRKLVEALRMISVEAKEDNSVLGRSVYKAIKACGDMADLAIAEAEKGEG